MQSGSVVHTSGVPDGLDARHRSCFAIVICPPRMGIAAIDIGTNSIHMIIARVHPRGRYEIVDSAKEMVRLGRGSPTEGVLMQVAQDRSIAALHRMFKLAKVRGTEEIIAVAT